MEDKNLSEDVLRGVPEHAIRTAVDKFANELRNHIFRFILTDKSRSQAEQKEAVKAADDVLKELKDETFELTSDKLWAFIRNA